MTTTKMLISAQRAQQLRVAIVEGTTLKDYQVDITDQRLTRGNIYRGLVANIQPSLNAAFIDIGEERHGFLPVGDVLPSAYHHKVGAGVKRPRIDQVLQRGKTVLVQVTKDGSGQKGAALTTNISIAGRYLVHTPFDSTRGISRKAEDDSTRKKIRDRLKKLTVPDGHGVIVRTNGLGQNQTTLNRDLNALVRLWKKVEAENARGNGPRLLYTDQDLVVQALRDYLDSSIGEVLVDNERVYEQAESYMKAFMPRSKTRLTLYQERLPLFSRYRLETQIDRITDRTVPLPGGGYLVIDPTEALTAIDVNSGRATKTANHDESIFQVNLEAAQEVARHLRLRDIGGLVVVDFIDMRLSKHKIKLEKTLRDAMKEDKARYSVHRLSPNGLLEINRQRIKQALQLRTHRPCPSCQGVGNIASPDFAALSLLGRLESRVATGLVDRVNIALHPEVADVLQNQHRRRLAALEEELDLEIEILSASNFDRTEERIEVHQRESGATTAKTESVLSSSDLAAPSTPLRDHDAVQSASENGDEEEENGKTRKRRRRRRSPRSRVAKSAEARSTESTSIERAEDQDPQTAQASAEGEAATETSKSRTRRPRRRRRPSVKTTAEVATPTEGRAELAAPAEAAGSDAPEKSTPRRRRRASGTSRRKVASSSAAPGTMSDTLPSDDAATEAPAEGSEDAPTRSRPARPGTARSRSGTASPKTARSTAAPADEDKASGERETKPRSSGRRRVTSRRKPTAARDPVTPSDNGQPQDLAEPQAAETPSATGRRRTATTKASSPVARPTSLEEQPPPTFKEEIAPNPRAHSNKLRWQWWGGGRSSDQGTASEAGGAAPDSDAQAGRGESGGGDDFQGGEGS